MTICRDGDSQSYDSSIMTVFPWSCSSDIAGLLYLFCLLLVTCTLHFVGMFAIPMSRLGTVCDERHSFARIVPPPGDSIHWRLLRKRTPFGSGLRLIEWAYLISIYGLPALAMSFIGAS